MDASHISKVIRAFVCAVKESMLSTATQWQFRVMFSFSVHGSWRVHGYRAKVRSTSSVYVYTKRSIMSETGGLLIWVFLVLSANC